MRTARLLGCALVLGVLSACGNSSPAASPSRPLIAVVAITLKKATVEPITTPGTGWLYRLLYEVRETGGTTGATLTLGHWALSNGFTTNDNFSGVLQVPHVGAGSTITVESHLSVLTTAAPASHVDFTITYMGDDGQTGSVSIAADISQVPPQ